MNGCMGPWEESSPSSSSSSHSASASAVNVSASSAHVVTTPPSSSITRGWTSVDVTSSAPRCSTSRPISACLAASADGKSENSTVNATDVCPLDASSETDLNGEK